MEGTLLGTSEGLEETEGDPVGCGAVDMNTECESVMQCCKYTPERRSPTRTDRRSHRRLRRNGGRQSRLEVPVGHLPQETGLDGIGQILPRKLGSNANRPTILRRKVRIEEVDLPLAGLGIAKDVRVFESEWILAVPDRVFGALDVAVVLQAAVQSGRGDGDNAQ